MASGDLLLFPIRWLSSNIMEPIWILKNVFFLPGSCVWEESAFFICTQELKMTYSEILKRPSSCGPIESFLSLDSRHLIAHIQLYTALLVSSCICSGLCFKKYKFSHWTEPFGGKTSLDQAAENVQLSVNSRCSSFINRVSAALNTSLLNSSMILKGECVSPWGLIRPQLPQFLIQWVTAWLGICPQWCWCCQPKDSLKISRLG